MYREGDPQAEIARIVEGMMTDSLGPRLYAKLMDHAHKRRGLTCRQSLFRYLAPNLITLSSMIFGLVSLWSSHNGDPPLAAWMIIYAVLTDRLDGLVARALKATSELGMQLDSFADFLNFGVAPAYLVLSYLSARPRPAVSPTGTAHYLLFVACGAYMLCAVFRLARYNVLVRRSGPDEDVLRLPDDARPAA